MSAGIEPLARSIRIWWKDPQGLLQRETIFWPPTADNHVNRLNDILQLTTT
jgi:hypothetical protein